MDGITLDSSFKLPVYSPVCTMCKHLNTGEPRNCAAFKEIPLEIWQGKNDHRQPFTGDNGIQFKLWSE
jgi:hypothetical protein